MIKKVARHIVSYTENNMEQGAFEEISLNPLTWIELLYPVVSKRSKRGHIVRIDGEPGFWDVVSVNAAWRADEEIILIVCRRRDGSDSRNLQFDL